MPAGQSPNPVSALMCPAAPKLIANEPQSRAIAKARVDAQ